MRYALLVSLLVATTLDAQEWEREQLPLRFAQADPSVTAAFRRDWNALARKGVEWGYCVTAYRLGATKDGDTVYVVTDVRRAEGKAATRAHVDIDCADERGKPQPVVHTHLTGDCTPSRADARDALRWMPPFAMILCGPGITASYDPRLYLNAAIAQQAKAAGVH